MSEYERQQAIKEIVEIYKSLSPSSQRELFNFVQKCEMLGIKSEREGKSKTTPLEEWRNIKKFKGLYQVSTLGRVRISGTWTMIEPKMKHGILKVALVKNNRCSILDVHQLVAEAFIPKVEGKNSIIHIDGNYENNRVENLKWGTPAESFRMMKAG